MSNILKNITMKIALAHFLNNKCIFLTFFLILNNESEKYFLKTIEYIYSYAIIGIN